MVDLAPWPFQCDVIERRRSAPARTGLLEESTVDLSLDSILHMSGWGLFIGLFLLPFVQEDAAVVAAATASLAAMAPLEFLFLAVFLGLISSDLWKYWAGFFARRNAWAHRFAEKPGVSVAGDLVRTQLGKTLFLARFVPGTRIPTYVACGFFKAPWWPFAGIVSLTAFTYVAISFALFHTVGAVVGENAKYWLPAIAVGFILSYLVFRWLRRRKLGAAAPGPLAPITDAPDHPLTDMPGFEGRPLEGRSDAR